MVVEHAKFSNLFPTQAPKREHYAHRRSSAPSTWHTPWGKMDYELPFVVVVVVVHFILSRLLFLAFSANLGLLCMPHPGMGSLI